MKAVKLLLFTFFMSVVGCSSGGDSDSNPAIQIDPNLSISGAGEVVNDLLADRELGVYQLPGEGKASFVLDRLVVEPVDQAGLDALLAKYQAQVIEDSDIPLNPIRRVDRDGVTELPSAERILQIDPSIAVAGSFEAWAKKEGVSLPVQASSERAREFLDLIAQIRLEDSLKFKNMRPAFYAVEPFSPPEKALASYDWATCDCLARDGENGSGELLYRLGATWFDEIKEAPIYNPFFRPSTEQFCTYNNNADKGDAIFDMQGHNVLILDFSSVYDIREGAIGGPEGNVHLWAFPSQFLPLEMSFNLDKEAPPGTRNLLMKGPSDKCEWWEPDQEQYIAYQNFVVWKWSDSNPNVDEEVGLLLWGGEECFDLRLFEFCHADELFAEYLLKKGVTFGAPGVLLSDRDNPPGVIDLDPNYYSFLDLRMRTVDYCRGNQVANSQDYSSVKEYCNGYDDTCDGKIDEGFELKGQACDNGGIGQCHSTGVWICSDPFSQKEGEEALICNAIQKQASPFEICDEFDNDCDGQTDEDWIQQGLACGLGVGTCGVGALGCTDGHISCEGEVGPVTEACDGLDNDCDGVTDEGCACTAGESRSCSIDLGPCSIGTQLCLGNGQWSDTCSGTVPQPEVCDGIDNNCNSAVDEGVLNACGTCGPVPTEVCDGIDNDCDGEVDEGVTNSCGGCWAEGPEDYLSGQADCDGIDNNCDGIVDNLEQPVTCGLGVCLREIDSVCEICEPGPQSVPLESYDDNTCINGWDDDCDGLVDAADLPDCLIIQGGG